MEQQSLDISDALPVLAADADDSKIFRSGAYVVKLDNFEGPMDLLLHLVKESKLSIQEIRLSSITEPYLAYMAQLDTIDLDKAAEFVSIATILVEIKVKAMLPDINDYLGVEEAQVDPEVELKLRMEKYALFKEASDKLKDNEDVNRFFKTPDPSAGDFRTVLKDMSLDGLLDAFAKLLHRADVKLTGVVPKNITKDRFTVADKILHIEEVLNVRGEVSFFELFEADYSRSEIINTFLALLELLRLQKISAVQSAVFQDITLTRKEIIEDAVGRT